MTESLLLIEGTNVDAEALRSRSLRNAKQLIYGRFANGHVVHLGMNLLDDLPGAVLDLSTVAGVTGITTLAIRK
jgi:hypothetical protein